MIEIRQIKCNGQHFQFFIGKTHIGNAEKVGDRWLVQNKRKQVETIKEAAKQMIDVKMSQLENEKARYNKLLQLALKEG